MAKWTVVVPEGGTHEIEADRMSNDADSVSFKTGPAGSGKTVAIVFKAPGLVVSSSDIVTAKS